jgi:acyl-CoA thioesterase-1
LAAARAPTGGLGDYGREFAAVFPRLGRETGVALTPDLLAGFDRTLRQRDDVHPTAAGVRLLAERMAPTVAAALRRQGRAPRS